jgi:hypothetical protein
MAIFNSLLAARVTYNTDINGIGRLGNVSAVGSVGSRQLLENIISDIIGALTVIAGIWFIYQIILASISWIGSNGDKQSIQVAQKRIVNSFIGLLVTVAAYAVTGVVGRFLGMPGIFDIAGTLTNLTP